MEQKKIITNVDLLNDSPDENVGAGNLAGIAFRANLSISSGTFDPRDLGTVVLTRGVQRVRFNLGRAVVIGQKNTTAQVLQTSGGSHTFEGLIPMGYPEASPNTVALSSNEELEVDLQIDNATISSAASSGSMDVFGLYLPAQSPRYTMEIFEKTIDVVNGTKEVELNRSNIVRVFMDDPNSLIDSFQVTQDDRNKTDLIKPNQRQLIDNLTEANATDNAVTTVSLIDGLGAPGWQSGRTSVTINGNGSGKAHVVYYRRA